MSGTTKAVCEGVRVRACGPQARYTSQCRQRARRTARSNSAAHRRSRATSPGAGRTGPPRLRPHAARRMPPHVDSTVPPLTAPDTVARRVWHEPAHRHAPWRPPPQPLSASIAWLRDGKATVCGLGFVGSCPCRPSRAAHCTAAHVPCAPHRMRCRCTLTERARARKRAATQCRVRCADCGPALSGRRVEVALRPAARGPLHAPWATGEQEQACGRHKPSSMSLGRAAVHCCRRQSPPAAGPHCVDRGR